VVTLLLTTLLLPVGVAVVKATAVVLVVVQVG